MKPHRVVMQAFGPYAQRQVVDFSELMGRSFFLIHGPTGAGKTTILDAMTFALYGVTSGDERRPDDMRSHHAPSGMPTEVEFEFAIGAERYLAHRSPRQERPKQRGAGLVWQEHEATLWRLGNGAAGAGEAGTGEAGGPGVAPAGEEGAEPRAGLASGWSRVTEKCEELLGFKAAQFRQVVLLPQGRFQELLRANSKERQEILETLFQTQFCRRLEDELKARAKDVGESLKQKRQEWEVVLRQAEAADEDELSERRRQLSEQLEQARAAGQGCRQAEEAARKLCDDAKAANERLDEQAAAEALSVAVNARRPEVEEARQEIEWAAKADKLSGRQQLVDGRQADLRAAQDRLKEAEDAAGRAEAQHEQAKARLLKEEGEARVAERVRLAEEVRRLKELVSKAAGLAEAEAKHTSAAEALALAADQAQAAARGQEKMAAARSAAEQALQQAQQLAERLPELQAAAEESGRRAEMRARLQTSEADHAAAEARIAETYATLQRAEAEHARAAAEAAELERSWAQGQAAVLAADLHPGAPCPVCGSTEHPAPAHPEHSVPGHQDVLAARAAVAAALTIVRAAEKTVAAAEKERAEQQATAASCRQALGAAAKRSAAKLLDEAAAAQRQCDEAAAAVGGMSDLQAKSTRAAQAHDAAATAAKEATAALEKATAAAHAAATLATERAAGLPPELRAQEKLTEAIAEAQRRHEEAGALFLRLQKEERAAAEASVTAATALTGVLSVVSAAQTALAEARARFGEGVQEQGFADESALAAARREPQQVAALEGAIKQHDNERAAADDRRARAAKAAEGMQRTQLEPLVQALTAAEGASAEVIAIVSKLTEQLRQCDQSVAMLSAVTGDIAVHEVAFSVIGRLSQVANGDNPLRLSFQRFVLGALLDDVLVAATRRLNIMSHGRYVLERTGGPRDAEHAGGPRDGRRAAGLDLGVLDEWTGMQRPVSTLSGGETFLAALSLALGLAEVVQAYAGGIHLDTVFVDEGFGSLDEEALAAALEALTSLQHGGRLVGIISHVTELQEQIDARLQISATRAGSSARFVVP